MPHLEVEKGQQWVYLDPKTKTAEFYTVVWCVPYGTTVELESKKGITEIPKSDLVWSYKRLSDSGHYLEAHGVNFANIVEMVKPRGAKRPKLRNLRCEGNLPKDHFIRTGNEYLYEGDLFSFLEKYERVDLGEYYEGYGVRKRCPRCSKSPLDINDYICSRCRYG